MNPSRLRIAVIGSGGAGLAAAWLLQRRHEVTLYESASRLGGHANTIDVAFGDTETPVDTGFIVYNNQNYPNFRRLLDYFNVQSEESDMSFSVSLGGETEYGGSFRGMFAQPANLFRPRYVRMLRDIVRFFRGADLHYREGRISGRTLGAYLTEHCYSDAFVDDYLLPMGAAIWSCPPREMLNFPAEAFVGFFVNHGLLEYRGRPQWRTISGGSREYVRCIARALPDVRLNTRVVSVTRRENCAVVTDATGECCPYDQVVMAVHADQARLILGSAATPLEQTLLGSFRYSRNLAVLHGDPSLMPKRRSIWSSWNYLTGREGNDTQVSVTYWMNRLQNLNSAPPVFLSLNPLRDPASGSIHAEIEYQHPMLDDVAFEAQRRLGEIGGRHRIWYCGSYFGHGFHEDAVASGIKVATELGASAPWDQSDTLRRPSDAEAQSANIRKAG